jgi:uncharacterized damage-inducible protein DinB
MIEASPFGPGLASVTAARANLLATVRALDPVQVRHVPAPGSWSIAQVVEHLTLAEELTAKSLRNPRPVERRGSGLLASLRLQVIRLLFGKPFVRARVPARALLPEGSASLDALEHRWLEAAADIEAFLRDLPAERQHERLFRHPVTGWLTLRQMLQFHLAHIGHHARQIARIMRSPGFPA